jgi:hypothetical protein
MGLYGRIDSPRHAGQNDGRSKGQDPTMLHQFLLTRYPGDSQKRTAVRQFVEQLCRRHIELGLADPDFERNLCCGDEARYWQRLSRLSWLTNCWR